MEARLILTSVDSIPFLNLRAQSFHLREPFIIFDSSLDAFRDILTRGGEREGKRRENRRSRVDGPFRRFMSAIGQVIHRQFPFPSSSYHESIART